MRVSLRRYTADRGVESGGDEAGEVVVGPAAPPLGFDVAFQEDVEEVVDYEQQQQEDEDGGGGVLVAVVGVPVVDEFVEALVFDAPALVPDVHDAGGACFACRQAGGPYPFGGGLLDLAGELAAHADRLQASHDADRLAQLRPRLEAADVPPQ